MNRFKAVGLHLVISLLFLGTALYFIVYHWYPAPYFTADGGWQGFRIVFLASIVLGPLLTLLVYKQNKAGLKFDLVAIGLLQAASFGWGIWQVYEQRTALVLFVDDAFHALSREQIIKAGLDPDRLTRFSQNRPPMAYLRLPAEQKQRREFIRAREFRQQTPVIRLGERYESFNEANRKTVISRGINVALAAKNDKQTRKGLAEFLAAHGGTSEDYAFVPIHCRYKHSVLALTIPDGRMVGIPDIPITPFY
jgi:hypothetical protein